MERSHEGRRSTRVRAQILLRVTSLDSASPFSEHCHTLVLNVQGCGVRLTRAVRAGLPVWLEAQERFSKGKYRRLVIAQDTGGAIRGPVRGDLFWGFGKEAADGAGAMNARGHYYLLLPHSVAARLTPRS